MAASSISSLYNEIKVHNHIDSHDDDNGDDNHHYDHNTEDNNKNNRLKHVSVTVVMITTMLPSIG